MAPDPVECCNSGNRRAPLPRKAPTPRQLTTVQKEIVQTSKEVAEYVIFSHVSEQEIPKTRAAIIMLELTKEVEAQNTILFDNMCSELALSTQNARTVFFNVTEEIFTGSINFGRIVTLYAFAGKMAQHFVTRGSGQMVERIINWVEFQMENLCFWMEENGSWNAFEKQFEGQASSWTSKTKRFLLAAVGIGVAGCIIMKMT